MNETNEIAEAKISWANTLLGKGFVMAEVIQLWDECLEFISNDDLNGAAMHTVARIDEIERRG